MKETILLLISLMAVSCSTLHESGEEITHSVYITDELQVTLMSLDQHPDNLELFQEITGRYGAESYNLQAYLQISGTEIGVTAYSAFGNTLIDLLYTDSEIRYRGVMGTEHFDPLYLVADLQFCYFPAESLEKTLRSAGLSLSVDDREDGWVRKVTSGNEVIIEITRKGSTLEFNNYLRDYGYSIEEYPAE